MGECKWIDIGYVVLYDATGYAGLLEKYISREISHTDLSEAEFIKLCGVKHFPIEGGRYIVFLFSADQFSGEVIQ